MAKNKVAEFKVVADGTDLTYQWKLSSDGGTTWKNSGAVGNKTDTLKVTALAFVDGYKFYCIVTDGSGNKVESDIVTLSISTLTITTQPESATVVKGKVAEFKVVADGTNLTYQWKLSSDGGTTWKNSGAVGNKTDTLKVTALASVDGYQFYCVVSDENGNSVDSDIVVLTIGNEHIVVDNIVYEIIDGKAVVLGFEENYESNDTSIIIPSSVSGYPVTEIGVEAFMNNTKLCPDKLTVTSNVQFT